MRPLQAPLSLAGMLFTGSLFTDAWVAQAFGGALVTGVLVAYCVVYRHWVRTDPDRLMSDKVLGEDFETDVKTSVEPGEAEGEI